MWMSVATLPPSCVSWYAAFACGVVLRSNVLCRITMCWLPSYVCTASLWVGPPFWFGSLVKYARSWMYESTMVTLSYALTPSTAPWMFMRVKVALVAHTPSRQALALLGAISVSVTVALAPVAIHSTDELHFGLGPPRITLSRMVTLRAVTFTKPWMSSPATTWPGVE